MLARRIHLALLLTLVRVPVLAQPTVIVNDKFNNNHYGWYEGNTEAYDISVKGGKYVLHIKEGSRVVTVSPFLDETRDFSIQASFVQQEGSVEDGFGLAWAHDGQGVMNSFTIASNGYYRIECADKSLKIPDDWKETSLVKPKGEVNTLKIARNSNILYFYINGKQVTTTILFPWIGKQIGFVVYAKMHVLVDDFIFGNDVTINLIKNVEPVGEKENLGVHVNSEYDEVSPKISADGRTLYFGRKHSPENKGGISDKEDIWVSKMQADGSWSRAVNMGSPVNTEVTNNLLSVSTDNNTLLFHTTNGFGVMHRSETGWSHLKDLGIFFKNESQYLEGSLSADGKAIVFVAKFKSNKFYNPDVDERDIYVCEKRPNGTWSQPIHTGKIINTGADEYSPVLSADGKTLYFASNGRAGYGDVDIFMAKRIGDGWTKWTEPVNLGVGINTVGFDAYYTLPASGEYGYMVSNINSRGLTDIIRFKIPKSLRPEPVVLVSGKVINAKTKRPLDALIRFDDLGLRKEVGEARSDPSSGEYSIVLPLGRRYGIHAAARGYLSVNENLELVSAAVYNELKKDLYLVPIEVGESIQLRNVFFVQSKPELKSESYPELDRLVEIMNENTTMEIELHGHTDNLGKPEANLLLSQQRVQAVKNYLVSKGIKATRISGRGFGGTNPVAPSDTEANRQLNRRVEFKITRK